MFQNHALFLVSCNQHLSEAKEYPQNEPWPLGLVPNIIAETYSLYSLIIFGNSKSGPTRYAPLVTLGSGLYLCF